MRTVVRTIAVGLACVVHSVVLDAKTLALWPIEWDEATGTFSAASGYNAVDGTYPMTFERVQGPGVYEEDMIGWRLPPNPDPSVPTDRALNKWAVTGYAWDGDSKAAILGCENIAYDHLRRTHDFTVESYVKIKGLPTSGSNFYMFGTFHGDGNNCWMFNLRNISGNIKWNVYVPGSQGGDTVLAQLTQDDLALLTNAWHHIAITHATKSPDTGKEEWKAYLDGVQIGSTISLDPIASMPEPTKRQMNVGGRPGGTQRATAAFDYLRVSDTALDPTAFLCAGGVPQTVPNETTVGYWQLGKTAAGGLDFSPSVGTAVIGAGVGIGALTKDNMQSASIDFRSDDLPFSTQPPNTLMTPTAEWPPRNTACAWGLGMTKSYLRIANNFGALLSTTNSFTVEGWFKPTITNPADADYHVLFGSRDGTGHNYGWTLYLNRNDRYGTPSRLGFFVSISFGTTTKEVYFLNGTDLGDWTGWKHLALVYKADAGSHGIWSLYLDGSLYSTAENSEDYDWSNPPDSWPFSLFGRPNTSDTWEGGADCVRVCRTALDPAQFLSATTGARPATDVLALWPLELTDDFFFDGYDRVGGWHLDTCFPDGDMTKAYLYRPRSSDDSPVVTNPDKSRTLHGNRSLQDGSALYWNPADTSIDPGGKAGSRAYLVTRDPNVTAAFYNRAPLTLELYFKRVANVDSDEILFYLCKDFVLGQRPEVALNIQMTAADGFLIRDNEWIAGTAADYYFGYKDAAVTGKWRHYAFVRTFDDSQGTVTWRLFADGELVGTVTKTARTTVGAHTSGEALLVGGRTSDSKTLKGSISHLRISCAALASDEFLCGSAPAPDTAPTTLAYWPLDKAGTQLDLSSRVNEGNGLTGIGITALDQTGAALSRPDTTPTFVGDPIANEGSIRYASGTASVPLLGAELSPWKSFTLEGWVRNPEGTLIETSEDGANGGWSLTATDAGLRLTGRMGIRTTMFVDHTFVLLPANWATDWHHLALVNEAKKGPTGMWTLFIDDKAVGTATNNYAVLGDTICLPRTFKLGSNFNGDLDVWRLSRTSLTPRQFLFAPGFMLLLR